jgi:hypothetical protein
MTRGWMEESNPSTEETYVVVPLRVWRTPWWNPSSGVCLLAALGLLVYVATVGGCWPSMSRPYRPHQYLFKSRVDVSAQHATNRSQQDRA